MSAALAVVSAGLSYTLIRTGNAYSQCFTAAYVVFLLGMGGQAREQTVPERVMLTLLGGALAMLAYLVFPAWETPRLPGRLADWLAANGRYAAAVLRSYAEPIREHRADMRRALLASRDARAAWQEAYDRAQQEPVRPRGLTSREAQEALKRFGTCTRTRPSARSPSGSRTPRDVSQCGRGRRRPWTGCAVARR
ncbi:putative membrane protein YccC [Streptacidiphilus sp. MAP5-52]